MADVYASFKPNLMDYVSSVKVFGKHVNATHDLGTVNDETRSFVDKRFLETYAPAAYAAMEPRCVRIAMKSGDERVIGRIRNVTVESKREVAGEIFRWLATLDAVFVVDALPVPIHISLKAAGDAVSEQLRGSNSSFRGNPTAELFPFTAGHPYWTSTVAFMGTPRSDPPEPTGVGDLPAYFQQHDRNAALGSLLDRDAAEQVACHCGVTANLRKCQRCRRAFYCSKICQRSDWRAGHREICTPPPPS